MLNTKIRRPSMDKMAPQGNFTTSSSKEQLQCSSTSSTESSSVSSSGSFNFTKLKRNSINQIGLNNLRSASTQTQVNSNNLLVAVTATEIVKNAISPLNSENTEVYLSSSDAKQTSNESEIMTLRPLNSDLNENKLLPTQKISHEQAKTELASNKSVSNSNILSVMISNENLSNAISQFTLKTCEDNEKLSNEQSGIKSVAILESNLTNGANTEKRFNQTEINNSLKNDEKIPTNGDENLIKISNEVVNSTSSPVLVKIKKQPPPIMKKPEKSEELLRKLGRSPTTIEANKSLSSNTTNGNISSSPSINGNTAVNSPIPNKTNLSIRLSNSKATDV